MDLLSVLQKYGGRRDWWDQSRADFGDCGDRVPMAPIPRPPEMERMWQQAGLVEAFGRELAAPSLTPAIAAAIVVAEFERYDDALDLVELEVDSFRDSAPCERHVERLCELGRRLLASIDRNIDVVSPNEVSGDEVLYSDDAPVSFVDLGRDADYFISLPVQYTPRLFSLAARIFALARAAVPVDETAALTWRSASAALFADDGLRCALIGMEQLTDARSVLRDEYLLCEWARQAFDNGREIVEPFSDVVVTTEQWLRAKSGLSMWDHRFLLGAVDWQLGSSTSPAAEAVGAPVIALLQEVLAEVRSLPDLDDIETLSLVTATRVRQALKRDPGVDYQRFANECAAQFGEWWSKIAGDVQERMVQAEYLRMNFSAVSDVDWSPVVIHYGRAIELLLAQYRNVLRARVPNVGALSTQVRVAGMLDERNLTLGEWQVALMEIAKQAPPGPFKDRFRRISTGLKLFNDKYRNVAAHGEQHMTPMAASAARDLLLRVESDTIGIAWQIVSALA